MKELKIYEWQAKNVADALRIVANILKSHSKTTSADRDVMWAWETMKNVLAEDIDKKVERFLK